MCRPKPFPRCSDHARKQLLAARNRLDRARAAVDAGSPNAEAQLRTAQELYNKAVAEYETSPEHIRNLKAEISSLQESGASPEEVEKVQKALTHSQARRDLLVHHGKLAEAARERLKEHQSELKALQEKADYDLVTEVLATEEAIVNMESARESVTKASHVIAQQYLAQGNQTYAWNPGLWALDHENPDTGEQTEEYSRYVQAGENLRQAERAYEEARQNEGYAKLQLALDKQRLQTRTAEIASGFNQGNTYEAYGASMVNPDGTTNAHYLTTIPGTDIPYYAKMVKVNEGNVILETGEQFPLREARKSDWKYTIPHEGATRGPELYRMDSSG